MTFQIDGRSHGREAHGRPREQDVSTYKLNGTESVNKCTMGQMGEAEITSKVKFDGARARWDSSWRAFYLVPLPFP